MKVFAAHVIFIWLLWTPAFSAPAVFWASDPVQPDETALVIGHELGETMGVKLERQLDRSDAPGRAVASPINLTPRRRSAGVLYLTLPPASEIGVYHYQIETPNGSVGGLLNRPTLYWAQGDLGSAATPGGELRLFGRCIMLASGALVEFKKEGGGERFVAPLRAGSPWTASAVTPPTVTPGFYNVAVWNGRGGKEAWSDSLRLEIKAPQTPATIIVSIKDFGARGDGITDDTNAFDAGLAAVAKTGGVLSLSRGRYLLTRTISIPPGVTLRGVDRDLTSLLWPDFDAPPENLVSGAGDFGLEHLTLYASNHLHVVSGGFEKKLPAKGNIHIDDIRIRASAYRGHITAEEAARRASKLVTGTGGPNGGNAIRLHGDNLQISNSDIYASGSSLYIVDSEGVRIKGNTLSNGRGGWYSISGCKKVIAEGNEFVGADMGASGGGVNTLFSSGGSSENIWLANNKFRLMHAWDREAMTTDSPGGSYYGPVAEFSGRRLKVAGRLTSKQHTLIGQGVFLLDGRGAGQFAQIAAFEGETLTLDRQWAIAPDSGSIITITAMVQNYLIVDNEFSDAGAAVQFYGTSVNQVVSGNSSARTAGFIGLGRWYHHVQPNWYIQYLDNRITDGTVYRGGPDNSIFSGEAVIGAYGLPDPQCHAPLVLGVVMRGNILAENARIAISGCEGVTPSVRAVLIEKNIVPNEFDPIRGVSPVCEAVVRDNVVGAR